MTARSGTVDAGDSLPPFAGSAGDSAPALATNASGLIGWLRKINDTLAGASGGTSSTVSVSNFPATQPVSASALPLPSGAATSANQPALNGDGGGLAHVTNFPATQPVSAASLPLPSGAATDSNSNTLVGAAGTSPPALATSASGLIGWLRKIVDTLASTLTVSISNASLAVTGTFWQATQPVSGTFWQSTQPVSIATNTPDVTDRAARLVGHVTVDNASLAITAASLPLPSGAAQDATLTGGTQKNRITDGTNTAAVKAASTAPATTDPALVVVQGQNGYASTIARLLSAAATTNSNLVKGSAGRLFKIRGYNAKAAVAYLKLYNKATAPTVGTDTPVVTIPLKASDAFDIDFGAIGIGFATGIGFGLTGAVADADTTALVAADVVGLHIFYA